MSYHRYITDDDRGASVPIKLLHSSQSRLSSFAPLHVISWPYLDIVSALKVGEHLLSLVRRCLTLCLMIYKILQSAHRPSDSRWRLIFSLPISTFSALGVSHVMRSINVRYLLTWPSNTVDSKPAAARTRSSAIAEAETACITCYRQLLHTGYSGCFFVNTVYIAHGSAVQATVSYWHIRGDTVNHFWSTKSRWAHIFLFIVLIVIVLCI